MAKNEQIKRLIEALVEREVRRLLPEAVKQVFANIISESVIDVSNRMAPQGGNAHKRRAITESFETEEWPTLGGGTLDTSRMADMLGYGDMRPSGFGGRSMGNTGVTIDMAMTENGTPVPIDPRAIPKELTDALNRDYSSLVKAWDKRKNGGS